MGMWKERLLTCFWRGDLGRRGAWNTAFADLNFVLPNNKSKTRRYIIKRQEILFTKGFCIWRQKNPTLHFSNLLVIRKPQTSKRTNKDEAKFQLVQRFYALYKGQPIQHEYEEDDKTLIQTKDKRHRMTNISEQTAIAKLPCQPKSLNLVVLIV